MEARGHGPSHRAKAKSAISGFATWLVEEKGLLRKNPTLGVEVPAMQVLAPRRLSPDQRYVLKNLVEKEATLRRPSDRSRDAVGHRRRHDILWVCIEMLETA